MYRLIHPCYLTYVQHHVRYKKKIIFLKNIFQNISYNTFHTRCTSKILVLPHNVSACLSTTVLPIHLHYILFPLLEIECEQGRSPTLGGVGKGGMVEGG
jgi:hypothetical protein